MTPASPRASYTSRPLSREAKLWVLLVGVNRYLDPRLPRLAYPALDCQALAEAIAAPKTALQIHHDAERSSALPKLATVRASLLHLVTEAQPQDTVLIYFSGHGILDAACQQPVLCLSDTDSDQLLNTGLSMQALLKLLSQCAARQQLLWLDLWHSMMQIESGEQAALANPTVRLAKMLRQRASQNPGFQAFLSCDQDQQSWGFSELGHGVFSHFLICGLRGEAADGQGRITVDALYTYVYHQTLHYIDRANQQLRLINQQKRGRGETQLQPEYPLQTPTRIGSGELVLGSKPEVPLRHPRQALVIEGLSRNPVTRSWSKALRSSGGFELRYFPQPNTEWKGVREAIQSVMAVSEPTHGAGLLYLRGRVWQTDAGEAKLLLKDGMSISRSWLRQVLRRSANPYSIVILDCPGATDLDAWVEDLQMPIKQGQCIIAAASPIAYPEAFTSILLETLTAADPLMGLPIAEWISQIQAKAAGSAIDLHLWLWGDRVMEILLKQSGILNSETDASAELNCPYLGLRAFTEDDAPFFFGREALTQQLLSAVSQQALLAVVGAAGSGKSSLVQAGIMAQLRQGRQIPGSEQWWVRSFCPGAQPLKALVESLVEGNTEADRSYHQLQLEERLTQGVAGFVHWLRSCPEPMVLLVIDAFEELFTLAPAADRQQFLDLVLGGLRYASDRFKVILSLHTDAVAICLENAELAEYLQRSSILIPPSLGLDGYRQAILRPAETMGLTLQPELVDVLLQELSHSSANLPLLGFALEQLWEYCQSEQSSDLPLSQPPELTLAAYRQQIGQLQGALDRKAQTVYDKLDPKAQACARWIFLCLTQVGEGTPATARSIFRSDLVQHYSEPIVDRTLQAFIAAKLIAVAKSISDNPDPVSPPSFLPLSARIELAHEILIQRWSTLHQWLEEKRVRLRSLAPLNQAAAEWQRDKQPAQLWQGRKLEAAEEIYLEFPDELSQPMQLFIAASLQARNKMQRQMQQRLQRRRNMLFFTSMLALAAIGWGGFAYFQRQQALMNEIKALNALSESHLATNHSLEALTNSVRAAQTLGQMSWLGVDDIDVLSGVRTRGLSPLLVAASKLS